MKVIQIYRSVSQHLNGSLVMQLGLSAKELKQCAFKWGKNK